MFPVLFAGLVILLFVCLAVDLIVGGVWGCLHLCGGYLVLVLCYYGWG